MPSKILQCTCNSPQQDKLHGPKMRVANKTTKKATENNAVYRCTVCEREITAKE